MGSRKYFNWDWEIGKWSEGESGSHEHESATNRSGVATANGCVVLVMFEGVEYQNDPWASWLSFVEIIGKRH